MTRISRYFRQRLAAADLVAPAVSFSVFLLIFAAPYWAPESWLGKFMRGPVGLIAAVVTMYLLCVVVSAVVRRCRSSG